MVLWIKGSIQRLESLPIMKVFVLAVLLLRLVEGALPQGPLPFHAFSSSSSSAGALSRSFTPAASSALNHLMSSVGASPLVGGGIVSPSSSSSLSASSSSLQRAGGSSTPPVRFVISSPLMRFRSEHDILPSSARYSSSSAHQRYHRKPTQQNFLRSPRSSGKWDHLESLVPPPSSSGDAGNDAPLEGHQPFPGIEHNGVVNDMDGNADDETSSAERRSQAVGSNNDVTSSLPPATSIPSYNTSSSSEQPPRMTFAQMFVFPYLLQRIARDLGFAPPDKYTARIDRFLQEPSFDDSQPLSLHSSDGSLTFPHTESEIAEKLSVRRRVYLDNKTLFLKIIQLKCMLHALVVYLPDEWIQLTGQFEHFKGIGTFDEPLFMSKGLMYFLDHKTIFPLFHRHFFKPLDVASRQWYADRGEQLYAANMAATRIARARATAEGRRVVNLWPEVPKSLVVPCLLSVIDQYSKDIEQITLHSSDRLLLTSWRDRTIAKYRDIHTKLEILRDNIQFLGEEDSDICAKVLELGVLGVSSHSLDPICPIHPASLSKFPVEFGEEAFYNAHVRMDLLYDAMLADLKDSGLFTDHLYHEFTFHPPNIPLVVEEEGGSPTSQPPIPPTVMQGYYDSSALRSALPLRQHFSGWEVERRIACFHELILMYLVLLDYLGEHRLADLPRYRHYITTLVKDQTYAMELIAGKVGSVLPNPSVRHLQQCVNTASDLLEAHVPAVLMKDILRYRESTSTS